MPVVRTQITQKPHNFIDTSNDEYSCVIGNNRTVLPMYNIYKPHYSQ